MQFYLIRVESFSDSQGMVSMLDFNSMFNVEFNVFKKLDFLGNKDDQKQVLGPDEKRSISGIQISLSCPALSLCNPYLPCGTKDYNIRYDHNLT